MPLSWNEIKRRALNFSREWKDAASEHADAKTFWDEFFNIFGISRRRIASFEQRVKKIDGRDGYIDLLWKGVLLIEHKSRGKNLDRAHKQALDYFPGLKERELPRFILVSDFARFRLYDLDEDQQFEFPLEDLYKQVKRFGFIAGYQVHKIKEQDPVNIKAAERMGQLHDQLKEIGYVGHPLEVYLVRLLFCMFAEDTGIFQRQQFQAFIEDNTAEDGSDLSDRLNTLFHVLNTPVEKRLKTRDESLAEFEYINGKLFEEMLPPAAFDSAMRQTLLECCGLDWSRISPAIFGSLFQSIMDKQARRNLGAHYTSEENILKLIKPLFLDDLWEEFEKVKNNKNRLFEFHKKLRHLTFLDPACGCGNFLVIAYRELRLIELEILRASNQTGQQALDVHSLINLDVDQFCGIEIEEFPAQIAQVALWLMDHQMNLQVSEEFGMYFARIPLTSSANIVYDNALRIDWNDVIPVERLSYILGNPPFVGAKHLNASQREDVGLVFEGIKNAGLLDFVAAWYVKAALFIKNTDIRCAFVSTNSITQGEQAGVLWSWMLAQEMKIFFAHRTFSWSNEAKGKAAVHCVIVGFSYQNISPKWLFDYESLRGEAHRIEAANINQYLVDASNVQLKNRKSPICNVSPLSFGSMPNDGGYLLLTDDEKKKILHEEPELELCVREFKGAKEFINSIPRWCLWLVDVSPSILKGSQQLRNRIESIRALRSASKRPATKKLAQTPALFGEIRQSETEYLLIPRHSSEARTYVPIGYLSQDVICGDSNLQISNASLFEFGVITSLMHNAWMRTVCGRIKSDYRYSVNIVYNNFPWPLESSDEKIQTVEEKARAVLDARAEFSDASFAELYDPLSMPSVLLKAHQALDKAVDAAYGKRSFKSEAERVAFLFELYQKYTSLLPPEKKAKRRKVKN
jgi:hypothetical protein